MLPNELPSENEPSQDNPSTTETVPVAPVIPQPTTNFATREDLMGVMESVKAIAAAIQQGAATRSTTPEPALLDPTDEEILNDLNAGKTTAIKRLTSNIEQRLLNQHILPLKEQGLASISTLVKDSAAAHPEMPYFKQFEKQIMELVNAVPLNQRANIDTFKTAYAIVAGQNMTSIVKMEVEKAIRATNNGDGGQVPSGTTKPAGYAAGVPTVGEVCGADAEKSLRELGWTPDTYAQKVLHHKTWAEAAAAIQKFDQEHPANA